MGEVIVAPVDTQQLYVDTIQEWLGYRTIVLNQGIDDTVVENVELQILKWNREDIGKSIEERQPIIMLVNSEGGDVFNGLTVCDIMENSITPIYTVCLAMAASMGYHIFLNGKRRYAFKNSCFLQHDGSVAVQNSSSKARDFMKFVDKQEQRCKDNILSHTTMSEDFYDKKYEQEFWMFADDAKELGIVDYIIGEDCSITDILNA